MYYKCNTNVRHGFRIPDSGFRGIQIPDCGFRGIKIPDSGFQIPDSAESRFRIPDSGFSLLAKAPNVRACYVETHVVGAYGSNC